MLKRNVNREIKKHRRDSFSAMSLRLAFLLMLVSTIAFSQTNNQQYDLNDPRNPNCPCHKFQKQAEVEYKQLQMKDSSGNQVTFNVNKKNISYDSNNRNVNNGNEKQTNAGNDNYGAGSQKATRGFYGYGAIQKKKNIFDLIERIRNVYNIKHSKIKKFRIKTSDCFYWD
jgi:hypothetical protein